MDGRRVGEDGMDVGGFTVIVIVGIAVVGSIDGYTVAGIALTLVYPSRRQGIMVE